MRENGLVLVELLRDCSLKAAIVCAFLKAKNQQKLHPKLRATHVILITANILTTRLITVHPLAIKDYSHLHF